MGEESEEKVGESLCRYHKKKQMCFCKNDNSEVQHGCKHFAECSGYSHSEQCLYWDRSTWGIVVNGWRHCRNPEAQIETYKTTQLQVDE